MTRPLSNDLRERVVQAIAAGETCRVAAARFGIAVSSAVKWSQRYRATGSVAPAKMGGYRKFVLEPHRAFIVERINQTPQLTLHQLKDELASRGVKVSHDTVWRFLRREGLRFKKKHCSLSSRHALTSPAGGCAGCGCSPASTRAGWCSSMKPGSRPTWRRCGAGALAAGVSAAMLRTATGAR